MAYYKLADKTISEVANPEINKPLLEGATLLKATNIQAAQDEVNALDTADSRKAALGIPTSTISRYTSPLPGAFNESPYEKKAREYYEGLTTSQPTEADRASIRTRMEGEIQSQIDAIKGVYANMITQESRAGEARAGRIRGVNVRGGLQGSDFASAAAQRGEDLTAENIKAIEAEAGAKIAEIRGKMTERVTTEYEARRVESQKNAESQIVFLKGRQDEARGNLKGLAKNGFDINQLKPEEMTQLLNETGYSKGEMELVYNANLPQAEASDFKFQEVGTDVWVWQFDRKTGEFNRRTDLDMKGKATGMGEYEYKEVGGTVLLFPKKGIDPTKPLDQQILQYGKKGEFATPKERPTSYQEWELTGSLVDGKRAGKTYAEFVKKPSEEPISLSKDQVASVLEWAAQQPDFSPEDLKKMREDENFLMWVFKKQQGE